MDKLAAFEVVRRARALIREAHSATSESTREQYRKGFQRMAGRGLLPETIAGTSRSYFFYRAAYAHHFSELIREDLRSADRDYKAGNEKQFLEAVARLENHVTNLSPYAPDPNGTHLDRGLVSKWSVEVERRAKTGFKQVSNSKRGRLRGLPADWRERMFEAAARSKYRAAVAVLALTGARPAEMQSGIAVSINGAEHLVFKINGVKTHGGKYGQETRSLVVAPSSPDGAFLLSLVRARGDQVIQADAGALSDFVRRLSLKVFPRLKERVSCYVYRHQLSADLKNSGVPPLEISTALGHSVDATKRFYGAAQSGRAGNGFLSATGSQPVREKTMEKIKSLVAGRTHENVPSR
jgi:integrase